LLRQPHWRDTFYLILFATALQSEGNPESEAPHSLLTWRMAKLSLN
jgi:hypothetical protein